ncbi:PEP-CTERM sorting domain-containing protein [Massilia sp. W12]|uniref:PEP-CTERM sorting domain-containing protein n=1 Tax=Massilia sp. W12 TaxID=3126507 RepID=UPI0030D463CB
MIKHALLCALLGVACSAHAAPQTWEFELKNFNFYERLTYQGYPGWDRSEVRPNEVIKGSFTADDNNQDGSFSLSELQALQVNGKRFMHCEAERNCPGASVFSFNPANHQFRLSVEADFRTPPWNFTRETLDINLWSWGSIQYQTFTSNPDHELRSTLYNNGATTWAFKPAAAVPEAETWGMLLAGMGAVGLMARRRRA